MFVFNGFGFNIHNNELCRDMPTLGVWLFLNRTLVRVRLRYRNSN